MVFIFFFTVTLLNGCGGCGKNQTEKLIQKSIKEKTGEDVDVSITDTKIHIKSKEGKLSIAGGSNLKLPESFPDDIPLYPKAQPFAIYNSGKQASVQFKISDRTKNIVEFYKKALDEKGWAKEASMEIENQFFANYKKGNRYFQINVIPENERENILVITYTEE